MVGILVASHGALAQGLLDSASMIMGTPDLVKAESLQPGDGAEEFRARMQRAISELDQGDGVLVLTDLFGATPSNSALYLLANRLGNRVEVLTGVNLPMLLEAIMQRELPLNELAEAVLDSARSGIVNAGKVMRDIEQNK